MILGCADCNVFFWYAVINPRVGADTEPAWTCSNGGQVQSARFSIVGFSERGVGWGLRYICKLPTWMLNQLRVMMTKLTKYLLSVMLYRYVYTIRLILIIPVISHFGQGSSGCTGIVWVSLLRRFFDSQRFVQNPSRVTGTFLWFSYYIFCIIQAFSTVPHETFCSINMP
jgi:hypothetical protein